jgi:hypothetical protein
MLAGEIGGKISKMKRWYHFISNCEMPYKGYF